MRDSSIPAPSALETIGKVTTHVRTSLLERNGVQNLRIISESRFLDLLKSFEESSRRAAKDMARASAAVAGVTAEHEAMETDPAFEENWSKLRAKHQESLTRIEGRMEKLSRAFQGIQGLFEKLQAPAESAVEAAVQPEQRPAIDSKQKALLREMLLRGDAP